MDSLFGQYEYLYLNHINETCRAQLICGIKGSGKTALSMNIFKFLYMNSDVNNYAEFHLVIPNYGIEQNDTYKFIKNLKRKDNVFVYNKFNSYITELIYQKQLKNKNKDDKIFFMIDDATGDFMAEFHNSDSKMVKIMTDARHLKINLLIISHHITGTLKPVYRSMFDFVILFNISNGKLLKSCYDEFISLNADDYNTFKREFNQNVKSIKYAFLMIDNVNNVYSFNQSEDWTINKLTEVENIENYL